MLFRSPKRFTVFADIHPFMHTFTQRQRSQPRRATASWSGAIRVRRLAQGHHETRLGGAGDRTSNLVVTSQPALPPELMPLDEKVSSLSMLCLTNKYANSTTAKKWPWCRPAKAVVHSSLLLVFCLFCFLFGGTQSPPAVSFLCML